MIPKTLTMKEACELYKQDRRMIVKLIKSGTIEAYRPAQKYLIVADSIDRWWKSTKVKPLGRPRKP